MAKKETFNSLMSDIADGKVVSASALRKYLDKMEIHSLRLQEREIDAMISVLESDKTDKEIGYKTTSARNSVLDELKTLKDAEALEDGSKLAAQDKIYTYIYERYIRLLNQTSLAGKNKYQLGHETAVGTKILQLLNELYDLKSGDTPEEIARRSKIIQQAIHMSHAVDAIDDEVIKDIRVLVGTGHGRGATHQDLVDILTSIGDTVYIEANATKVTGASTLFGVNPELLHIEVRPEAGQLNVFTGALTARILDAVRGAFTGDSKKFNELLKGFDMYNMEGSASPKQIISASVDKAFGLKNTKDIKKAQKRSTTKVRVKRKIPQKSSASRNLKTRMAGKIKTLKTKLLAQKNRKKFIIPTVTLKALINRSLAEFIRERMEESNAQPSVEYLRNQTGRFSESAYLLTLNRQQTGAYTGIYTYQKEPYQVFERGEEMGSPGRDPRLYIEGAAREIAQQVLKKQFKGISLESK